MRTATRLPTYGAAFLLLLTACGGSTEPEMIGPAGGSLSDSAGTTARFPSGLFATDIRIELATRARVDVEPLDGLMPMSDEALILLPSDADIVAGAPSVEIELGPLALSAHVEQLSSNGLDRERFAVHVIRAYAGAQSVVVGVARYALTSSGRLLARIAECALRAATFWASDRGEPLVRVGVGLVDVGSDLWDAICSTELRLFRWNDDGDGPYVPVPTDGSEEVELSGKRPVVFVHGLQPLGICADGTPPDTWLPVLDCLRDVGMSSAGELRERFTLYVATYVTLRPIGENALQLARRMREVFPTSHSKASFVAHSMGGLVVRAAFQGIDDVGTFSPGMEMRSCVTLGTPHLGSPWPDLIEFGACAAILVGAPGLTELLQMFTETPGVADLRPSSDVLARLNAASPRRDEFFERAYLLAGDDPPFGASVVALMAKIIENQHPVNDGLVSGRSAVAALAVPESASADVIKSNSLSQLHTAEQATEIVIRRGVGHTTLPRDTGGCPLNPATDSTISEAFRWLLSRDRSAINSQCLDEGTVVYSTNFELGAGAEWTSVSTVELLDGTSALGRFGGDEVVDLALADLPAHSELSVCCDLYVIDSWDGDQDEWHLAIVDGPSIIDTSFSNHPENLLVQCQAYPDELPACNPPRSGIDTWIPGMTWYPGGHGTALYRLSFTVAHASPSAVIRVSSRLRTAFSVSPLNNESWALDNVVVSVR